MTTLGPGAATRKTISHRWCNMRGKERERIMNWP
jgi:hypothetical protein